jgi:DNA-binding response OmpR family regulator
VSSIVSVQTHYHTRGPDRRSVSRGGRRVEDQPGRYPRIAIVEPYDGVRRPCVRYLEHFNFDVAEASTLDKGIELLATLPPAVVLVEASDSAAFHRLQEKANVLAIPLLSLTTAFPDVEMREAVRTPAGVLLKPFTLGAMLDEIRRVLRGCAVAAAAQ